MPEGGRRRGGGGKGKSLAEIQSQQKRANDTITQLMRQARAAGDTERLNQLNRRRLAINNRARSYQAAIRRNQEGNKNARYNKVDRAIYTNGQMGHSRIGGVGKFKADGSTKQQSGRRKSNLIAYGARRGTASARYGGSGNLQRAMAASRRNRYMRAGVRSGIETGMRTNSRTAIHARNQRTGSRKRVYTNITNARRQPLRNIIRRQRKSRNR